MNPFWHAPVGVPAARLSYVVFPLPARRPLGQRSRRRTVALSGARRRWTRLFGRVALMGGLAMAAMPACALDANAATLEQLQTIHGVGPRTAKIIIQERERAGPFESLEDLSDRVRGIGQKRLERMRGAGLTVGSRGVTVFGPPSIASPQFAPALPSATPVTP